MNTLINVVDFKKSFLKASYLFLLLVTLFLGSCTSTSGLYSWKRYDRASYDFVNNSDQKSIEQLKKNYQQIIDRQTGTRGVVPPGIYADYGYLLFQEGRRALGREMIEKEIALYPESNVFLNRILKTMEE